VHSIQIGNKADSGQLLW